MGSTGAVKKIPGGEPGCQELGYWSEVSDWESEASEPLGGVAEHLGKFSGQGPECQVCDHLKCKFSGQGAEWGLRHPKKFLGQEPECQMCNHLKCKFSGQGAECQVCGHLKGNFSDKEPRCKFSDKELECEAVNCLWKCSGTKPKCGVQEYLEKYPGRIPGYGTQPCQQVKVVDEGQGYPEEPSWQELECQTSGPGRNTLEGAGGEVPEHLWDLYVGSCAHLEHPDQQRDVAGLLYRYQDVFSRGEHDVGLTQEISHDIPVLPGTAPIKQPPHRLGPEKEAEVQRQVKGLLDKGLIEPASGAWSSPVVLVRKKDGTWRFCVDYRRLNAVNQYDAYLLPRIDESLDALSGRQYFSTLSVVTGKCR